MTPEERISELQDVVQGCSHFLAPLGQALGVKSISGERVDATLKRVVDAAMRNAAEVGAQACERLVRTRPELCDRSIATLIYAAAIIRAGANA